MITIVHGNHHLATRKLLIEEKAQARQKGLEIIELLGKKTNLTELKQALESASLFLKDRLVVIENLFSLPKSKNKQDLTDYLKSTETKNNLLIWEGKQIDGRVLRSFSSARIKNIKLPAVIFKFLDSLNPPQPKTSPNLP